MSFELRLDVPAAKSTASTSPTRRPRSTASRATPAPVMPPPTTRTSRSDASSAVSMASRVSGENGEGIAPGGPLVSGAQFGEHGLRLGDLVGAPLLLGDLERARREGD